MEVIKANPGMKVVKETFTDWSSRRRQAGQRHPELEHAGRRHLDLRHRLRGRRRAQEGRPGEGPGHRGRQQQVPRAAAGRRAGHAVTNPAAIGGVGTAIAIDALNGKNPEKKTTLTPEVWDMETKADTIKEYYDQLPPTYSSQMIVKPYTTYTKEQLTGCPGPVGRTAWLPGGGVSRARELTALGGACYRMSLLEVTQRRQALRARRRAQVRRARRRARRDPCAARRQRRRQEHAREDPDRGDPARRGHDRRQRRAGRASARPRAPAASASRPCSRIRRCCRT